MKKLLFITILSALLLISCSEKPNETPELPQENTPSESITEEFPDKTPEEPSRYEEFEYKVTARDYESVRSLSYEEMAKEFLSAVCLGDREVLEVYMQGATVDELLKIKADAIINNGRTVSKSYGDSAVEEYLVDVRLIISSSESTVLPVGIYDYVLNLTTASMYPIGYFGAAEGFAAFDGSYIPSGVSSPALYNAYLFTMEVFRNYGLPSRLPDVEASFDSILHTAVHTRMVMSEDYVFTTTLNEFKEYVSLQFGYTDEALLQSFADALAKAPYAESDENGVYTVCCAHGYGSLMCDLMGVEMTDGKHVLTYAVFSDSTHTVKCGEVKFTFEENKDSDVMTLVEVESTKLNDLDPAVISV